MPVVTLTDAFIKGTKCPGGQKLIEFRDAEVRELELRVSARGTKSWRLHYTRRSDGKRRVVGLGTYPALPLKEARAKAKGLQNTVESSDTRADPAAKVEAVRKSMTFAEVTAEWIERHGIPNKSPRALRDDRSMLDRHVIPQIGAMKAVEVTKRDVIRLLDAVAQAPDARVRKHSKPRTLTHRPNRVFELVRSIFRWAVGRDVLQVDPTWGVKPPIKKEAERERNLSSDEICKLWKVLLRTPLQRRSTLGRPRGERAVGAQEIPLTRATAIAMKLSLVTGQRISEVIGIELSEIESNFVAPVWTVPGKRTKNKKPNRVPLSPLALRLISEAQGLAGESEWLFPSPKGAGPMGAHAATKALDRARHAIGLDDFRIHDLRRTAATRMAELGISPHTISLILNHSSARRGTVTSRVYVQYSYDKEKREALEKWSLMLTDILQTQHDN